MNYKKAPYYILKHESDYRINSRFDLNAITLHLIVEAE